MTSNLEHDVIIIGGGAAGLAAAVALGRARRRVLVVDAGRPRNAPAEHAHNYLGLEGISPLELLRVGRDEARSYGVDILDGTALSAAALDGGGFTVDLDTGTSVRGRRLLVTTGLTDELPAVDGLADRWGREVLHCPYCHGWEVRDQTVGIIGGAFGVHQALMWRQWSDDVVLFTQDFEPSDEDYEKLAARGIGVVTDKIAELEIVDEAVVGARLVGGTIVAATAFVVKPSFVANAGILISLGLKTTELMMGDVPAGATFVATDPVGATSVAGVWAAGNVAAPMDNLIGSAAGGVRAAGAVNGDLIEEDVRLAVEARNSVQARPAIPSTTPAV